MSGDLEAARQAYVESARICEAAGDIHLIIVVTSNLANILVEQGSIREAARTLSETLQLATRPDGGKVLIAGRLCIELSQVYFEFDRLEEALRYAQQGVALCRQWGNMDLQAVGYAMLAQLEHLRGHAQEAQAAMQSAERLAKEYDIAPRYSIWVKSALARLSILQGNLEKASHLLREGGIPVDRAIAEDEIAYLREPLFLVLVRLLLAKGEYDAALALSRRLLEKAEAANRLGRVIEILALEALAFRGKRDMDRALAVLERALSQAEPEGYTRVFLDEGEPMARLLYQARAHGVSGAYASQLLAALDRTCATPPPPGQRLIEPLTRRELELLKLIRAGCTNQDIADKLVISIPTVKRHISNINSKLGAKNRTQAVSLARELGLFE
jgi:LuxR family maltose regulon positive regulatory protein